MQNVLPRFKKRGKVLHKFVDVYLTRLGFGAVCHSVIEIRERYALAEIVNVLLPVKFKMEADIFYISFSSIITE